MIRILDRNFSSGDQAGLFEMDPNVIGPDAWEAVSLFLRYIWLFVLSILVFASNMLIGHNAIPSLVQSRHISSSFQKLRVPVYTVAVIAFGAALVCVFLAFQHGRDAINLIYPEFWI